MRRLVAAAAVLCVLLGAASANAEGVNNLMAGINGLLTFPMDPVWSAVEPPEATEGMFGEPVLPHVVGFGQGTLMMAYRAVMGVMDIALFPFWVFPTLSPEARLEVFSSVYEVEYP
jgi:hypothetical protein